MPVYCIGGALQGSETKFIVELKNSLKQRQKEFLENSIYRFLPKKRKDSIIEKEVSKKLGPEIEGSEPRQTLRNNGIIGFHSYDDNWPTAVHIEAGSLGEALFRFTTNEENIYQYLGWIFRKGEFEIREYNKKSNNWSPPIRIPTKCVLSRKIEQERL